MQVFIANISYNINYLDLYSLLNLFGPLTKLKYDSKFAFATYKNKKHAQNAAKILNGIKIYNCALEAKIIEPKTTIETNRILPRNVVNEISNKNGCKIFLKNDKHTIICKSKVVYDEIVKFLNK